MADRNPRTKRRKRLAGTLVVLAMCLLATGVYLLPVVARHVLVAELTELGFSDIELARPRIGLRQSEVRDLQLGREGRLSVESVTVAYGWRGLLKRRARSVQITRAVLGVSLTNGRLDLGPLEVLRRSPATSPTAGDAKQTKALPFDRIDLNSCGVTLDIGDVKLPILLSGALEPLVDGLLLSATGNVLNASIVIRGKLPVGAGAGTLTGTVGGLELARLEPLTRELVPSLAGYQIRGAAELDATMALDGGRQHPELHVAITNGTLHNPSLKLRAEGIQLDVTVTNLAPLRTASGQTLAIATLSVGDIKAAEIRTTFSVLGRDRILLERAHMAWAGGQLEAAASELHPVSGAYELRVKATQLDLQACVDLFDPGRIECEGRLDGAFSLGLRPADNRPVMLRQGLLRANPRRGWIRMAEPDVKTLMGIGEIRPVGETARELVPKMAAAQALQDLEYTTLTCRLFEAGDRLWNAEVKLGGSGPRGAETRYEIGELELGFRGQVADILNRRYLGLPLTLASDDKGPEKEVADEEDINAALDAFF